MLTSDEINQQQSLLEAHRRTLTHLVRQAAQFGGLAFTPPQTAHGITDARAAIARIKAILRESDVMVEDQPNDQASDNEAGEPRLPSTHQQHILTISGNAHVGVAVAGDVHDDVHHYYPPQPPPTIDPNQAQQQLGNMPLDTIPDPAPLPPGSRLQLRRNPLFVGREADRKSIARKLKSGGAAAITTGIGGVGKTQLAVEFAHRYGRYFVGGVFWLSFADPAGIDSEIAACGGAGAMELYSHPTDLTQDERVAKVLAEWGQPIPRLLIFDNCDDLPGTTAEKRLSERLPTSGGCRVLVTSRRGQWRRDLDITALPLGLFSRAESIALLRGHRDDISDADADAIANEMGDLPLALSLAGSYLERYADEAFGQPAAYLINLRKQLLAHRSLNDGERSVRATFDLSYQRLNTADPTDALAIAALARAARLAPGEPFPRELLLGTLGDHTDNEEMSGQRADALRRLVALGLLEVAAEGALRIHRLLAAFAQKTIADDEAQAAIEQALVNAGNGLINEGYPARLSLILAHLRYVIVIADSRSDILAGALANVLGRAEQEVANYVTARPLYERALAIREQVLGSYHPDTAESLNNLAGLFRAQGEYASARLLLERALHVTEQVLGSHHLDTALRLNNLALLLLSQGEYASARPLLERALHVTEQVLGSHHPDTALSLNSLAGLFRAQGENASARPLLERALTIREEVLGSHHPLTALSLTNLAGLLSNQGEYASARPLLGRALSIRQTILGERHPDTAQSFWWLGRVLAQEGDRDSARKHLHRAAAIYVHTLRERQPTTQECLRQLAALDAPSQTPEQHIAHITAQAETAVAAALADPSSDRAALAERLEARARRAEEGEAEGSPYLALARHLRTLATRLEVPTEAQHLAELLQRAQDATEHALAEDNAAARNALAERLEAAAQRAEEGEQEGSPYLALAAHLRALVMQLTPDESAND